MSNIFRVLAVIALVSFSASPLHAASNSPKAKNLLLKAKEATAKASFKSTTLINIDGEPQRIITLYRMAAPDGTILEKIESTNKNAVTETFIQNKTGAYIISADSVMKTDNSFADAFNPIYMSISEFYNEDASYSMTEEKYKNIPCRKITLKLPTKKNYIEKLAAKLNRHSRGQNNEEIIRTTYPFTKDYFVGKENNFIYGCNFYNIEGKKTMSCSWGSEIDFKTKISADMFQVQQSNIARLDRNSAKYRYFQTLFIVSDKHKTPDEEQNNEKDKTAPAIDTTPDKPTQARNILLSALRTTERTSFSAQLKIENGDKKDRIITEYHKVLEDGTVRERVEYLWKNSWKETYIPGSTTYVTLDKTQVKASWFMGSRLYLYKNLRFDSNVNASYTLEEDSYNGEPCYKITVKFPTEQTEVEERLKKMFPGNPRTYDEMIKKLPFTKVILVGKKNNFIYASTLHDISGKKMSSDEWGEVTFDPVMKDSLFELQQDEPALAAQTLKEFCKIKDDCVANFNANRKAGK